LEVGTGSVDGIVGIELLMILLSDGNAGELPPPAVILQASKTSRINPNRHTRDNLEDNIFM
jgi:hypothetical protein